MRLYLEADKAERQYNKIHKNHHRIPRRSPIQAEDGQIQMKCPLLPRPQDPKPPCLARFYVLLPAAPRLPAEPRPQAMNLERAAN